MPPDLFVERLTGARILKAERGAYPWLVLHTDQGEFHCAGGRVRIDLVCPRCQEQRLTEIVTTAGKEQAFCAVCSHVWVPETTGKG